jgi:hypothetical protein
MVNTKRKVHYWKDGDRVTRCGRTRSPGFTVSADTRKVTCEHCLTPNKPFSLSLGTRQKRKV